MDINSINQNNVTLTLNFSVEQVQSAITEVFSKKAILYIADKEHCTDTVFRMDVYNGINPASISLTIDSEESNKTTLKAVAQNANGGHASDMMLTDVLKDYLKYLQKALNGDFKNHKSGCMGKAAMITTLLVATVSLLFLV